MGLKALQWAFLGWLALPMAAHGNSQASQGAADQVYHEMRTAGAQFGEKVAEAMLASLMWDPLESDAAKLVNVKVSNEIGNRAAWWVDMLRHTGLHARSAERLVTVWATAAHEASGQRLTRRSGEQRTIGDSGRA
jgi:hypothetical protein